MKFITHSAKQTQKLGQSLAQQILQVGPTQQGALVLGLQGDLGSGKTTFLQGFAKGLGVRESVTSPTFVVMKRFALCHCDPALSESAGEAISTLEQRRSRKPRFNNFYHLDCYRLERPEDLLELGWQDIVSSSYNIVAIEWPERVAAVLPKLWLKLQFTFLNPTNRQITINPSKSVSK